MPLELNTSSAAVVGPEPVAASSTLANPLASSTTEVSLSPEQIDELRLGLASSLRSGEMFSVTPAIASDKTFVATVAVVELKTSTGPTLEAAEPKEAPGFWSQLKEAASSVATAVWDNITLKSGSWVREEIVNPIIERGAQALVSLTQTGLELKSWLSTKWDSCCDACSRFGSWVSESLADLSDDITEKVKSVTRTVRGMFTGQDDDDGPIIERPWDLIAENNRPEEVQTTKNEAQLDAPDQIEMSSIGKAFKEMAAALEELAQAVRDSKKVQELAEDQTKTAHVTYEQFHQDLRDVQARHPEIAALVDDVIANVSEYSAMFGAPSEAYIEAVADYLESVQSAKLVDISPKSQAA